MGTLSFVANPKAWIHPVQNCRPRALWSSIAFRKALAHLHVHICQAISRTTESSTVRNQQHHSLVTLCVLNSVQRHDKCDSRLPPPTLPDPKLVMRITEQDSLGWFSSYRNCVEPGFVRELKVRLCRKKKNMAAHTMRAVQYSALGGGAAALQVFDCEECTWNTLWRP